MPHMADASEPLPPTNDEIVTFHQLPRVNHPANVGPMAGLQIPRIVPIGVILVPTLTLR